MNKRILLTGATGFIGKKVALSLLKKKYDIELLIRPKTSERLTAELAEKSRILEVDLRNIKQLRELVNKEKYYAVIHIAAIRNRPKTKQEDYLLANVNSTEQLALAAMNSDAKFIYFSSVGVYGSVPENLPAGDNTKKVDDNHYHWSKNQSEKLIAKQVLYGLKAAVIRPAITYGAGDTGFPFMLINMIATKKLLLPKPAPIIHLCHVNLLSEAVNRLLDFDYKPGCFYNIGDFSPVNLLVLADFINQELRSKAFPKLHTVSRTYFTIAENFFSFINNTKWQQRFSLFSHDWYYDVNKAYEELKLKNIETIPSIRSMIEWYKKSIWKKT